jgi:hypothetical protein
MKRFLDWEYDLTLVLILAYWIRINGGELNKRRVDHEGAALQPVTLQKYLTQLRPVSARL